MTEYCCYCEVELLPSGLEIPIIRKEGSFSLGKANKVKHPQSKTKEHLFPRHLRRQSVSPDRLIMFPCCYKCNSEKSHLTLQEFIEKLKKVSGNELRIENAEKLIARYKL